MLVKLLHLHFSFSTSSISYTFYQTEVGKKDGNSPFQTLLKPWDKISSLTAKNGISLQPLLDISRKNLYKCSTSKKNFCSLQIIPIRVHTRNHRVISVRESTHNIFNTKNRKIPSLMSILIWLLEVNEILMYPIQRIRFLILLSQ